LWGEIFDLKSALPGHVVQFGDYAKACAGRKTAIVRSDQFFWVAGPFVANLLARLLSASEELALAWVSTAICFSARAEQRPSCQLEPPFRYPEHKKKTTPTRIIVSAF